jgi:TPR repeat protein
MKKTKHASLIAVGLICLFCLFLGIGLFVWLCFTVPHFAPDWVIQWQNEARASSYRKAAERGNAEAMRKFGQCYFSGIGVPCDHEEAAKWLKKAAEHGDVAAHCHLAYCYFNGEGVPEDKAEAVRLYRIAAELGDIEAQWKLGVLYLNGIEVPKDEALAVVWIHKAAEQNYYHAQYLLGRCYFEGTGVPKDDTIAAEWLRKITWLKEASALLQEIHSDNPRDPNPDWGIEALPSGLGGKGGTPTPPVK